MKPGLKFLHSVFEVAHVEFQTYDLSHQKLLFSSGMIHRLLGYSEAEYAALSHDFYKHLIHPDDVEMVKHTIDRVLSARPGDVIEMTARLRKADGHYIWLYSRQMLYDKHPGEETFTIIREVEDVTRV